MRFPRHIAVVLYNYIFVLDTDYSRIIPNTNELIIHAGTSGSISRASSDTDVSRNSYSNYEATAPHASLFIDEVFVMVVFVWVCFANICKYF